jgi:subtilisin family serine protease
MRDENMRQDKAFNKGVKTMKKFIYLFITLMLAACGSQNSANISSENSNVTANNSKVTVTRPKATVQSVLTEMKKGQYVQGQLLVKYKTGAGKSASLNANKAVGAAVISKFRFVPTLEQVQLPQNLAVQDAITQYMSNPDVEYAEPNYIRHTAGIIPYDPYFHNQYALLNTGQYAYGTIGADIKATEAWQVLTGYHGVAVAVLDTGIDYNHPDLIANMWRNDAECYNGVNNFDDDGNGYIDDCAGWNFVTCNNYEDFEDTWGKTFVCSETNTPGNDPMDDYGHGTHVAGIIGAVGNNGIGISGVMWNALLMPVKVFNKEGQGSDADIVAGLEYAMNKGARIVNASFGGYGWSDTLFDAFQEAADRGVLVVASAGNDSNNNDLNPVYPASYIFDNIISVAATDQDDKLVSFSNVGIVSVDVAAPGVYIFSTVPTWLPDYQGYAYLDFYDGTSMSAPHVAGLAGLLSTYYYNFTSSQIRKMVLNYVDFPPSLSGKISTAGRINAWRSMSALWEPYDLKLDAVSLTQVNLTWTDVATNAQNYLIERKEEGGDYSLIKTLESHVNSYTDNSGFKDGTKYFYRVRVSNWIGESPGRLENERSIIVSGDSETHHRSGGGGGCSIGAKQNLPTAFADLALLLVPFIAIAIMRRRR